MKGYLNFKNGKMLLGLLLLSTMIACNNETNPAKMTTASLTSPENDKSIDSQPISTIDGRVPVLLSPLHEPITADQSTSVLQPQPNRLEMCGTSEFGQGAETAELPLHCIRANYAVDGPGGEPFLAPQKSIKIESYIEAVYFV